MVARPDAALFLVANDATTSDRPQSLATGQTCKDVVDAPSRFVLDPSVGVSIRPGDALSLLTRKGVISRDRPGVHECNTFAVQRMQACHVSNLVRARLGIEISDDDRREAILRSGLPGFLGDEHDLFLSNVAVIELPMKMRTGQSDRAVRAVHGDTEGGSTLPVTPVGESNLFRREDPPTTRDCIPESEMRAIRERHRRAVLGVEAAVANEFSNLVDALAYEHFLEPDEIGFETLDPLPDESRPLGPRALIMPDVQGEDFQRHAPNLAATTHAYRFSEKKSATRRSLEIPKIWRPVSR
jgi:hypothetical protein